MAYRDTVKQDLPLAYWKLDEAAGATTAGDEMGNHDGTYNGSPALETSPVIQSGTAVEFDGTDDYIEVPDHTDFDVSALTVEAWINTTMAAVGQIIGRDRTTGGKERWVQFRVESTGELSFIIFDSSDTAYTVTSTGTVNDGAVHHVAGSYDGTTMRLYIDSVEVTTSSPGITMNLANEALYIGARYDGDGITDEFSGQIDEVAVYDYALTATEIRRHYYAGLGYIGYAIEVLAHGVRSYWKLDEESGAVGATDEVGGNTGTYTGGVTLEASPLIQKGTSAQFDGVDDTIDMGDVLDPTGDFTWECWFSTTVTTDHHFVRLMDKRGQGALGNNVPGAQLSYIVSDDGASNADTWGNTAVEDVNGNHVSAMNAADHVATSDLNDGNPHLVQLVWEDDTGTMRLFYDGAEHYSETNASMAGAAAAGDLDTAQQFRLGAANTDDQYLEGTLDEVVVYDRALSVTEARRHYYAGLGYTGYALEIMTAVPVAYWRLDEESGTTAADETGDHNGTYNGDPVLGAPSLIRSGAAVEFDGAGEYVTTNWAGVLGTAPFTVGTWLISADTGDATNGGAWAAWGDAAFAGGKAVFKLSSGNPRFEVGSGAVEFDATINDGNPHYVVITHPGGGAAADGARCWVDGVEVAQLSGSTTAVDIQALHDVGIAYDPMHLADTATEARLFIGTLDEVYVFNRALTEAEIQDHYGVGLHGGVFYRLLGTVNLDGSPGVADVRAFNFTTNELIDEVTSAGDGTYEIAGLESDADLLVVAEADGYRPLAHGPVTPEES